MIGNDVVDILQSRRESNWQRPGFIQKLFTAREQLLIHHAEAPETMVWLLWSMKEAAYKIYNRRTKLRQYLPKKLECSIICKNSYYITGQVSCFNTIFYTQSAISDSAIHTVAVTHLDDLNNIYEIKNEGITKDCYGIPYLKDHNNRFQDVSISHHGRLEKVVTLKLSATAKF